MKKSIRTEEFRVPPGVNVKLKDCPTRVKPYCKGDVLFLPAVVGACPCQTRGAVSLLEISLPEARRDVIQ